MKAAIALSVYLGIAASAPAAEPTIVGPVQVSDLARTFQTNQARADEQYTDKTVRVTGEVARVFRAPHGHVTTGGETDYIVELRSPDLPVQFCCAAKDRSTLAKLEVGQRVTIRALCCGKVPGATPAYGDKERVAVSVRFYGYEVEIAPRGK